MGENLVSAVLRGVIAFVVTLILLIILGAIFDAIALPEVSNVIDRFAWLIALLVGIVVGWNRYDGTRI